MAATATCNNVWTLQSLDSAAVGRLHDGAFLQSASGTPNAQYRAGVIPTVMQGGNAVPLDFFVTQTTVASMGCLVGAGNAVVANASRGPYLFSNPTNGVTLTLATSNPTNPRIDLVYLQVVDNPPDTGTTGGIIGVVTGTPAGSPAVPALPTNGVCIPLAQIAVAANATSITNSNITDVRKSAGVGRGPRFLLPGDSLSDPAFCYGEQRQRRLGTYALGGSDQIVTDYWGYDGAWHGMKPLPLPPGSITQNVTNWPTSEAAVYTISVPAPGFAYFLELDVQSFCNLPTSGQRYGQLRVILGSLAGTVMYTEIEETNFAGTSINLRAGIWNGTYGTPFTGAQTVIVSGFTSTGTNLAMAPQSCGVTVVPV